MSGDRVSEFGAFRQRMNERILRIIRSYGASSRLTRRAVDFLNQLETGESNSA